MMTLKDINSWYLCNTTDIDLVKLLKELYVFRQDKVLDKASHIYKLYLEISKEHSYEATLTLIETAILGEAANRWYKTKNSPLL